MNKLIDARTLAEHLDEILDEAASGMTRFVVSREGKPHVWLVPEANVSLPKPPEGLLEAVWASVEARGLPPLTMDEIDEEIAACRREKRKVGAAE